MAAQPGQLDIQTYQPAQLPDPIKPPKESPFQGHPGFQFSGAPISHAGAVAGVLDNILRGYVNGKAQGEAHKALTLKKKSDDLGASYNADAARLYQVAQSQIQANGKVDPSSPDYQAAQAAVSGSWGALQDFRGSLLEQQDGGKKTKGQKKDANVPPAQVLTNPASSPQEKAQALHALSMKVGPPVIGQIQTLQAQAMSPQAQQQRATETTTGQAEGVHATNTLTREQAQSVYDKYAGKSDEEMAALPKAEQDAYANAKAVLTPIVVKGTTRQYISPDGKTREWYVPGQEPKDWSAAPSGAAPKPVRAWTKDAAGKFTSVLLDPATNKAIPGTENGDIQPPSSLSGRISTGFFHWVDADGNEHQQQETRTSAPMASASGGGSASSSAAPKTMSTSTAAPSSTAVAPPASPKLTRRTRASAPTATAAPSRSAGDHILGHKGTTEEVVARKQADVLDTAFRAAIQRLKNPTPIGDQALVFDWVRSQIAGAGRMTNTEIQQAYKAGSFETRARNAIDRAMKGTLDPTFRRELVNDIGLSARAARQTANSYNPKPEAAASSQHKVGDIVQVGDHKVKITAIDAKTGKASGEIVP